MRPLAHTLKQNIQRRNKQDANHRRHQHPAEYRGADDPPALPPALVASIIGMIPIINDTAVINTARKRRVALARSVDYRQPSFAGCGRTQRSGIAFFAARAISSTSPI